MAIIVQDSFNRADSTSSLGVADTGQSWVVHSGTWGIVSNQAYTSATTYNSRVTLPTNTSDGKVSVDLTYSGGEMVLLFRFSDASNHMAVMADDYGVYLYRYVSGTRSLIGASYDRYLSAGIKLEVEFNGADIIVRLGGEQVLNVTEAANQTNTRHGIGCFEANTGNRWDNFLVESLETTEPTGTDGSTAFDLRHIIYTDSTTQADTRQTIYSDGYLNGDTRQTIYQDGYRAYDLRQMLYANLSTSFDTKQALFEVSAVHADTRQVIYETASTAFDTLQEYYQDGQTGATPFDLRIQLYEDSTTLFDSRQEWFEDGYTLADLKQAIYEAGELNGDMKLILYSDSFIQGDLRQLIYSDEQIHFDTKQTLYDTKNELIGVIHLKGERKLYIELSGKRELYVPLKGGVSMTINNPTVGIVAGDSKYLVVSVDGINDLTGCTFKWGLNHRRGVNILEKTSVSGISVVGDTVQIKLDPSDTVALRGTYYYECEMTDTLGNVSTICTGILTIQSGSM